MTKATDRYAVLVDEPAAGIDLLPGAFEFKFAGGRTLVINGTYAECRGHAIEVIADLAYTECWSYNPVVVSWDRVGPEPEMPVARQAIGALRARLARERRVYGMIPGVSWVELLWEEGKTFGLVAHFVGDQRYPMLCEVTVYAHSYRIFQA